MKKIPNFAVKLKCADYLVAQKGSFFVIVGFKRGKFQRREPFFDIKREKKQKPGRSICERGSTSHILPQAAVCTPMLQAAGHVVKAQPF